MTDKYIDSQYEDSKIHEGHRSRMRDKLRKHGQFIFDSYELLEMLLYYTVPYKDTNPVAKRLLKAFGDLDGVLSASREELMTVSGIGERTADLLKSVDRMSLILGSEPRIRDDRFTDHCRVGRFLISCFEGVTEKKIVALYFDNSMNLIAMEEVYTGIDYDSGAVTAKPFLDSALRLGAVAVITAHNHLFGSAYPTVGDRATNQNLKSELEKVRITLAEHYVICGDRYTAIVDGFVTNYSQSLFLDDFIKSRDKYLEFVPDSEPEEFYYNTEDLDYFSDFLSFADKKDPNKSALMLIRRFSTIENTLTASGETLEDFVNGNVALYIKLAAYVTSRRRMDKFVFNRRHTMVEIADYFKALYIGIPIENVYMMCFDLKGRATVCEKISEGIVNSADVLPRKLLEIALRSSAAKVVIVHNHPFGRTVPSPEDIDLTVRVIELFRTVGIELSHHLIVSGQNCDSIRFGEPT